MSDLEWYLDVGGKQSGPHTAKEIVDLVRAGKIPASSHVTAARMSGDWVTAQDLVDAYSELYTKTVAPSPIAPIDGAVAYSSNASSNDPNFKPPPRPTEQLEASRIITLNREKESAPDPTDALFQAIQAAREKAIHKSPTTAPMPGSNSLGSGRDPGGPTQHGSGRRIPSQLLIIATLAAILGGTIYGISEILSKKAEKKSEVAEKGAAAPTQAAPVGRAAPAGSNNKNSGGNRLLNEGVTARPMAPRVNPLPNQAPARARAPERYESGGGARYRDERDEPVRPEIESSDRQDQRGDRNDRADRNDRNERNDRNDRDDRNDRNDRADQDSVNRNNDDPDGGSGSRANFAPMPVDPSQVSPDRILPDPMDGPVPPDNAGRPTQNTNEQQSLSHE